MSDSGYIFKGMLIDLADHLDGHMGRGNKKVQDD